MDAVSADQCNRSAITTGTIIGDWSFAFMAFWYQTLPIILFPELPGKDDLEIIKRN